MTRRARRRVEAALVLLALPVAVAVTIAVISTPVAPAARASAAAVDRPVVRSRVVVQGGDPLPSYELADRLADAGYEVVSVDPAENSLGNATVVVYYERDHRAAAERLRNLLGVGTIEREQVLSPSSDLTILIGKDLQHT